MNLIGCRDWWSKIGRRKGERKAVEGLKVKGRKSFEAGRKDSERGFALTLDFQTFDLETGVFDAQGLFYWVGKRKEWRRAAAATVGGPAAGSRRDGLRQDAAAAVGSGACGGGGAGPETGAPWGTLRGELGFELLLPSRRRRDG